MDVRGYWYSQGAKTGNPKFCNARLETAACKDGADMEIQHRKNTRTGRREEALLLLLPAVACWLICGCAPAKPLLVGPARAPIAVEQVVIYQQPPANSSDVAILKATSHSAFSPGGPAATDTVVQRLKLQAAQLGANGLVLQGFSDAQTASLGTGVGSESYSRSSSVGVGAGASFGIFKKTGEALAIYVPPAAAP